MLSASTALRLYKWMRPADADVYAPDSPHPSSRSRFCDASYPTLYLAETAEGAMAEFFRSNSSFLAQQAGLKIRLFSIAVEVLGLISDLRDSMTCSAVGIQPDRLISNDSDPNVRWAECQAVARLVRASGAIGILYPSAAYADGWNLVLFDWPGPMTWLSHGYSDEAPPYVDPSRVAVVATR